jgi:hypothetical protein
MKMTGQSCSLFSPSFGIEGKAKVFHILLSRIEEAGTLFLLGVVGVASAAAITGSCIAFPLCPIVFHPSLLSASLWDNCSGYPRSLEISEKFSGLLPSGSISVSPVNLSCGRIFPSNSP